VVVIESLDDAWKWYSAVKKLAADMRHLAGRCDSPEWRALLDQSNRLRELTAADLQDMADTILDDLADLVVLVLFSVFEASVRTQALSDVDRSTTLITHAAVKQAVKELKEAITSGSFARVTAAFQQMDVNLTEQVNQVRKYRNWVAHGRREAPEHNVTPEMAFDRLGRYLALMTASLPAEPPPLLPETEHPLEA
jgi:hypothetical protein